MAWIHLLIAGLFEVVWAISLKGIEGFSKPMPIIITIVGMIISFYFLSLALKSLPIGTAYAIWTGIGAVGVAIYGIIILGESANFLRIICLFLIVSGIAGLKILGGAK